MVVTALKHTYNLTISRGLWTLHQLHQVLNSQLFTDGY